MGWLSDVCRNAFGVFLRASRTEDVVAQHVIREHHQGRGLADILADSYVTNRLSPPQVQRLLDRPDILHAVGEDMVAAHRADAT